MVHLRALSGDARLLHVLSRGVVRGRVHSVFRRTVNIETVDAALCTLATPDTGNAPETLVVDSEDLYSFRIAPGDNVISEGGVLQVGGRCRIAAAAASRWSPTLPLYPADDSQLHGSVVRMREQIEAHARRSEGATFAARARALLSAIALSLRDALASGDADQGRALAASLLGLGEGLTPAGDDFLVGLFTVLNLRGGPAGPMREIIPAIVQRAATRTNTISIAALRAAAQGRVRERVITLLDAVLSGAPDAQTRALRCVLAIGSTSGAYLASGIVCGFDAQVGARRAEPTVVAAERSLA